MILPTSGFSSKKVEIPSPEIESTALLASLFPNLVLVCPSNCGSDILTETTAVKPSLMSSPDKFLSDSF